MNHDEFAHADAAYLLGALGAAERRRFEEHLETCRDCRRAVRDLAGVPGLLARAGEAPFADQERVPPLPVSLLPGLLAQVRRSRRRRTRRVVAAASAAALLSLGAGVATARFVVPGQDPGPGQGASQAQPTPPADARPMHRVGQGAVDASLAMEEVPWGTRLQLTCTYPDAGDYDAREPVSYALVVRTIDGRTQQVATWRGVQGRTISVTAATEAGLAQIVSVEVRTSSGEPVAELGS